MFNEMYEHNYGEIMKKWAKTFYVIGILLISLGSLIGFIFLCLNSYAWLLALSIIILSVLWGMGTLLVAHFTWGFAEIVTNTQKMTYVNHSANIINYLKSSK